MVVDAVFERNHHGRYLALEESLVASCPDSEPHSCQVERHLEGRVNKILSEVEATLIQRLLGTKIAEISGGKPLRMDL